MTTLPAMTPEQIREIALAAGCTEDDDGALVSALVIGAVSARDAQWAAAVDAAVMQERAECAKLVETQSANGDYGVENWFHYLADRIRARTKEKT